MLHSNSLRSSSGGISLRISPLMDDDDDGAYKVSEPNEGMNGANRADSRGEELGSKFTSRRTDRRRGHYGWIPRRRPLQINPGVLLPALLYP